MEQLNRLIKDAANQFQCHNFQTSLSLYVRCINRCIQDQIPKYVLNNLKSSEAGLRTILGQYENALRILNQVLDEDKQHCLSLIRRSQVYKKLNKFKKAMKDLEILSMYAPDNMQVVALKLELKGMMTKKNGSSSDSSEEDQLIDQEQFLKFSNLKKIDRTSISMLVPKGIQSKVSISGDQCFFYESAVSDNKQKIRQSKSFTPSFNCKRYIQIDKQLQETISSQKQLPAIIKSKTIRTKSILKNRESKIYYTQKLNSKSKDEFRKLLQKIQDIDGSIIKSSRNIDSIANQGPKEVGFRKSLYLQQPFIIQQNPIKSNAKPGSRKSCLKICSFNTEERQAQKKGPRYSKFDALPRNSIDGNFIRSDKKKKQADLADLGALKQKIQRQSTNIQDNQSESQQGSQYNIFGSKKVVINQQLRENLGLGSDSAVEEAQKRPKQRKNSILKTTSIVIKKEAKKKISVLFKQQDPQQKQKPERKTKKSVMFVG